jgi:hypothetical protein
LLAQPPQPVFHDDLLDHLQGHWVLRGTIMGQPNTHDIDARWVLGHQYLRLDEASREKKLDGQPDYEASVHLGWDAKAGRYLAIWLDVWGGFGAATVGYAAKTGDEIRYLFDDGKGGLFHTTFIYDRKADTWEWQMDNDEKGKRRPFLRAKLTRQ